MNPEMRKKIEENDTQILVVCEDLEQWQVEATLKHLCITCEFKKDSMKDGAKELHCCGPKKMEEERMSWMGR